VLANVFLHCAFDLWAGRELRVSALRRIKFDAAASSMELAECGHRSALKQGPRIKV